MRKYSKNARLKVSTNGVLLKTSSSKNGITDTALLRLLSNHIISLFTTFGSLAKAPIKS